MKSQMKFSANFKFNFLFILLLASVSCNSNKEKLKTQTESEIIYQCAPCGCDSDHKHFDHPGNCPSCGMKLELVTKPFHKLNNLDKPMNVAILIYPHAQVLDYAGPYDVFTSAGENFNVYTVAESSEEVTTFPNLSVNPQYTILNSPKPDIIIIPGGMWTSVSQKTEDWISKNAKDADYLFSICTGAFILAEMHLLDGLEATTHSSGLTDLEHNYPSIKEVKKNVRYVDNGKVITSAGVSAGIDASIHLVSKILGEDWSKAVIRNLEYQQPRNNN